MFVFLELIVVRCLIFLLILLLLTGCSEAPKQEMPVANNDKDSILFDGEKWSLIGPNQNTGDIGPLGMLSRTYSNGDASVRLLEMYLDDPKTSDEGAYSRILGVQILKDGEWISHGLSKVWYVIGGRGEEEYYEGVPHGLQRTWYANGQKNIERMWKNGQMHGPDRAWWPDGKPQYEIENQFGKEVSGKAWRQDGTSY